MFSLGRSPSQQFRLRIIVSAPELPPLFTFPSSPVGTRSFGAGTSPEFRLLLVLPRRIPREKVRARTRRIPRECLFYLSPSTSTMEPAAGGEGEERTGGNASSTYTLSPYRCVFPRNRLLLDSDVPGAPTLVRDAPLNGENIFRKTREPREKPGRGNRVSGLIRF